MMKMLGLFLALFVSAATAQQRCCLPEQFEAILVHSQGWYNSSVPYFEPFRGSNNLSVDYAIQRYHSLATDGFFEGIRHIVDWTQDQVYLIFPDGTCFYGPISQEDPLKCVPDEAVYLRNTWMGFDDEKLHVDDWQRNAGGFNYTFTFTQSECTPVYQTLSGPFDETSSVIITQRFVDMTLGIRDPGIFEIPPNCQPGSSKQTSKKGLPFASFISMYADHPEKNVKTKRSVVKPRKIQSKIENILRKRLRNV